MNDSFADHPQTVGELRADRSHLAADWTPRECLIATLRDIDNGKYTPDALIVVHREKSEDGGVTTSFIQSSPDVTISLGMLSYTQIRIVTGAYEDGE